MKPKTVSPPLHVNIVTLGCPKNQVDSEKLAGSLAFGGALVTHGGEIPADVVIINTCSFINDAREESIDTILEYTALKKSGRVRKVYVTGCLAQRYEGELRKEIPELDGIFGFAAVPALISDLVKNTDPHHRRILTTPPHYAYLKIAEGCERSCSFCAIPSIRGRHVSVPEEILLREARDLVSAGVKELIVVAQDTTWYGIDIYRKRRLPQLLVKLAEIPGLKWIRLHYAFPAGFPEELAEVIAAHDNICKYLDIPLQHISTRILDSMRRGSDRTSIIALLAMLRRRIPDLALRTSFITGYPGETSREFNELLAFVRDQRFHRLGVFPFSPEEGTSAAELHPRVRQSTTLARLEKIMELQQQISLSINTTLIGKSIHVLVDSACDGYFLARTQADSPEIDNEVIIAPHPGIRVGEFCRVKIESAGAYDLSAKYLGPC